jgi:hypothetical protein
VKTLSFISIALKGGMYRCVLIQYTRFKILSFMKYIISGWVSNNSGTA